MLQALVITSDQVAAISLDGGPSIATRTEPTLPEGFRVALVEFPGKLSARAGMRFTPLDANGQPIPQSEPRFSAAGYQLITQSWRRPGHAPRGACQITSSGLPGLTAQSGNVVPRLQAFKGLVGRPFMSCASIDYNLHNRALEVGAILDATHPGSIPAPLPNMKPISGHTGVFQAQGPNGEMLANAYTEPAPRRRRRRTATTPHSAPTSSREDKPVSLAPHVVIKAQRQVPSERLA